MRDNPMCIDGPLFRGRDKPPMTISEEEHVARAIQARRLDEDFSATITLADGSKQWVVDHDAALARAAIAAIREREGAEIVFTGNIEGTILTVTPDPAPWMVDYERAQSATNPAEAMRAKCEAIARGMEPHGWRSAAVMQERIAAAIAALKGNGEGR